MKTLLAASLAVCLASAAASAQQAGPTPRTADGHPDLSGLWTGNAGGGGGSPFGEEVRNSLGAVGIAPSILVTRDDNIENFERDNSLVGRMGSKKPLYKPQYWETVKKLDQDSNTADPGFNCMPPGIPRSGPPAQIVQTKDQLIFLYPGVGGATAFPATYRVIPIDGRKHSNLDDLDGTWFGESIGHWEGDTMVIDSIGFNSSSWLDTGGYFHSQKLPVIEKLTRNANARTWQVTSEDPDGLLKPWVWEPRTVRLNPDAKAVLPESLPCSERDHLHYVTKEHH